MLSVAFNLSYNKAIPYGRIWSSHPLSPSNPKFLWLANFYLSFKYLVGVTSSWKSSLTYQLLGKYPILCASVLLPISYHIMFVIACLLLCNLH